MRKRLAVLINPTAGGGRAIVVGREVREQLAAAGHEVIDVSGASAVDADNKLRTALHTSSVDAVIAVGGDGLINLAASALVGSEVPLAIVPAGTGDDIARGLGISRRTHRVVAQLGAAFAGDQIVTRPVDVGEIVPTDGDKNGHRYFLSVLTGGLDAAVNARANGMRFPRGRARYLLALLAQLRDYGAYDYEITLGGRRKSRKLILACVANLPYFGGGMRIAPTAHPESGTLQAVLVRPVSLIKLLWVFPRIFWGGHTSHPAVEVVNVTEIGLGWSKGRIPPAPFVDGEPAGTRPLSARVVPGALQLVELGQ